jgi:aspartyl-tRNA(Asn)/glutamyl-tRNA(Gln) amidotransferase subunit A
MEITRRRFAKLAVGATLLPLAGRLARGERALASPEEDPALLTLTEASARIRAGTLSSSQLTEACLARISVYDPKLNAFITVMADEARARAILMDAELKAGRWRGPLHGIPLSLKDLIDTAGTRTTEGSAVFAGRVPTEDATVTSRLKDAGAVIIGKANLHEFGMNGAYFSMVRNPWNLEYYSGGSSSGSAASVSACLCCGSLGTDTGGSVRGPASYCSIVGLKATYGLVPLRGIFKGVLSLDHCGPMARTVQDTAMLLNQIAGYDDLDISSVDHPREDYVAALNQPVKDFRLGLAAQFFDHLNPEVAKAVDDAIEILRGLTRGTRSISMPPTAASGMDPGGPGIGAEIYAYQEEIFRNQGAAYMLPDRQRLEELAAVHGGDAAAYIRGRWELERIRRTIDRAFADVDLVVLPARRVLAPRLADFAKNLYDSTPKDPSIANFDAFNVYGIPAVSVPCGFSKGGLPIGLMIAGPHFSEGKVLALANAYEQATAWHRRLPPLAPDSTVPSG